jgi:hypothetical protein
MKEMKPEHVTPEMVALIKDVTDAEMKDQERIEQWQKQRMVDQQLWDAKSKEERKELIQQGLGFQSDLPHPPSKWVRDIRRKIRYRLFRIRDGQKEYDNGLKAWIEMQFSEDMSWGNFTFEWDVAAAEPLKVITAMEWLTTGGTLVFEPGTKTKACDPAAFTKQEM